MVLPTHELQPFPGFTTTCSPLSEGEAPLLREGEKVPGSGGAGTPVQALLLRAGPPTAPTAAGGNHRAGALQDL